MHSQKSSVAAKEPGAIRDDLSTAYDASSEYEEVRMKLPSWRFRGTDIPAQNIPFGLRG
jgi:hypothetical protein